MCTLGNTVFVTCRKIVERLAVRQHAYREDFLTAVFDRLDSKITAKIEAIIVVLASHETYTYGFQR